jgi:hypothetical protein
MGTTMGTTLPIRLQQVLTCVKILAVKGVYRSTQKNQSKIAEAMGWKNANSVTDCLYALCVKGYLLAQSDQQKAMAWTLTTPEQSEGEGIQALSF